MMWCVGAFLELGDRIKLEEFMRDNEEFTLDMPVIPEGSEDSMFDFFVDEQGTYMWNKHDSWCVTREDYSPMLQSEFSL